MPVVVPEEEAHFMEMQENQSEGEMQQGRWEEKGRQENEEARR